MGKGKGSEIMLYRILIAVAAAGAIVAAAVLLLAGPSGRKAPVGKVPAIHAALPKPAPDRAAGQPGQALTAPRTERQGVMARVGAFVRQKKKVTPASPAPQTLSQGDPRVPAHPRPLPLSNLGMPLPAAPGQGIDVATLKAACVQEGAADLSTRLGFKKGDGSGKPVLRAAAPDPDDHLHASIGGYNGRPISERSFTVNVGSTFR